MIVVWVERKAKQHGRRRIGFGYRRLQMRSKFTKSFSDAAKNHDVGPGLRLPDEACDTRWKNFRKHRNAAWRTLLRPDKILQFRNEFFSKNLRLSNCPPPSSPILSKRKLLIFNEFCQISLLIMKSCPLQV